jgi:hypothetical protein
MMNIRVHACTLCSMGGGEGGRDSCLRACGRACKRGLVVAKRHWLVIMKRCFSDKLLWKGICLRKNVPNIEICAQTLLVITDSC